MKKAKKASKHAFFIQQRTRGSSEGSEVTLEVPDELTLKILNEGAGVIPEVLDELSDYSSCSSFDSEFVVKVILSDEADVTEKADQSKKTDDQKAEEEHVGNQGGNKQAGDAQAEFLNDNPDVNVNEVFKDPDEPEVQSMVDFPITQAKLAEQRTPLVDTTITLIPDLTMVSPTQPPATQLKRSKIKRILKKSKRSESQVDVGKLLD
ncbi:hypothetical protein Tco_0612885 [Tanacetum coccineum]